MKYTYIFPVLALLIVGVFTEGQSQRKGTKKRESTTTRSSDTDKDNSRTKISSGDSGQFLSRLNSDIKIGNVGLTGNFFSLGLKANSGYKLTDWFSAGVAAKYQLFLINNAGQTNDVNLHDFGGGVYARARILQQFYAQIEYDVNNVAVNINDRTTIGSWYAGGGYLQGWGNWKFGAEGLFILNNDLRDIQESILEVWFQASYNF